MGRREQIEKALRDFANDTDDIVDAGVISRDGLMLASIMSSKGIPEERLAAVSAATIGLCSKNNATFGNGDLEHIIIRGSKGYMVIMQLPETDGAALVITTNPKANLGMLLMGLRDGSDALRAAF